MKTNGERLSIDLVIQIGSPNMLGAMWSSCMTFTKGMQKIFGNIYIYIYLKNRVN